jgi:hypothetical protein
MLFVAILWNVLSPSFAVAQQPSNILVIDDRAAKLLLSAMSFKIVSHGVV